MVGNLLHQKVNSQKELMHFFRNKTNQTHKQRTQRMNNQISCAGVSEKHLWILWAVQSADQKENSNKTYTTTVRIHGSREGTDLLIILSNSAEISSHTHCLLFKKTEKLCGNTEGENVKQYVGIRRDTNKCCQDTSDLMDTTEFSGKNMH